MWKRFCAISRKSGEKRARQVSLPAASSDISAPRFVSVKLQCRRCIMKRAALVSRICDFLADEQDGEKRKIYRCSIYRRDEGNERRNIARALRERGVRQFHLLSLSLEEFSRPALPLSFSLGAIFADLYLVANIYGICAIRDVCLRTFINSHARIFFLSFFCARARALCGTRTKHVPNSRNQTEANNVRPSVSYRSYRCVHHLCTGVSGTRVRSLGE